MSITKEMEKRIKNICSNEDGVYDIILYQICTDIYYKKELNKEQLTHIFFITDNEQKYDIIFLMNLCKT